ncbi:MAG: phasin family protein [Syntrophales bacterium]|nr:phasin family protein [Syntrophales bacterium]
MPLLRKSLLMGAGLILYTAEKMKSLVDEMIKRGEITEKEVEEALKSIIETSRRTKEIVKEKKEKILTEITAYWYYSIPEDDIEEKLELIFQEVFKKLNIPQKEEVEELRVRIEKLEQRIK